MIDINVIASGSSGNCTLVTTSAGEKILFDVGIAYKKFAEITGYVDYAIITHEHTDHAHLPAIKKLLENGTDVYMTKGTRDALELEKRHNLHTFTANLEMPSLRLGSCKLKALGAMHDAAEPIVFQIYDDDDRVFYSTDTRHPTNWCGEDNVFTKVLIEANFSEPVLLASDIDKWRKERVFNNHTSIERVIGHFEHQKKYVGTRFDELYKLKEIHLIHVSKDNGNAEIFKAALEAVMDVPILFQNRKR